MGRQTDSSLSFLPSWESWSTGRAMGLPVSFHHGLSSRPRMDLVSVIFGLLAQTVALLSARRRFTVSFWSARVVARRLPSAANAARVTGL